VKVLPDHLGSTAAGGARAPEPTIRDVDDVSDGRHARDDPRGPRQGGKLPCTLIVLDEVQQFIGSNNDLALDIQEVTEACSKQLDSRVMFLGTGQSALSDTPKPAEADGALRDQDATSATTTSRTSSAPSSCRRRTPPRPAVQEARHQQARGRDHPPAQGHQDRHAIGRPPKPTSRTTRSCRCACRFWERVLHSVDPTGTTAQMRTQLRVVHEACRAYGDRPLGAVVPGGFPLRPDRHRPRPDRRDAEAFPGDHRGAEEEARRRAPQPPVRPDLPDQQAPRETAPTLGVRADPEHLADLLSDDLVPGSTQLRQQIPGLLKTAMEEDGVLMEVEGEYRLQTTEGAAWESEFRKRRAAALGEQPQLAAQLNLAGGRARRWTRRSATRSRCCTATPRSAAGSRSTTAWSPGPRRRTPSRSGCATASRRPRPRCWPTSSKLSTDDRHASTSSCPRASCGRSQERASPRPRLPRRRCTTRATRPRARAVESRQLDRDEAGTPRSRRVEDLVGQVHRRSAALSLRRAGAVASRTAAKKRVEEAAKQVLSRLYPRFHDGDSANWPVVLRKAKEGNANALAHVGFNGDPQIPSGLGGELLKAIGAGKKGTDLRKVYCAPPYGWPQDAIDAAPRDAPGQQSPHRAASTAARSCSRMST
jgi:hypothetical protein